MNLEHKMIFHIMLIEISLIYTIMFALNYFKIFLINELTPIDLIESLTSTLMLKQPKEK